MGAFVLLATARIALEIIIAIVSIQLQPSKAHIRMHARRRRAAERRFDAVVVFLAVDADRRRKTRTEEKQNETKETGINFHLLIINFNLLITLPLLMIFAVFSALISLRISTSLRGRGLSR